MKFRISVSKEKYDQIKDYLTKMGIETGDDAEYLKILFSSGGEKW